MPAVGILSDFRTRVAMKVGDIDTPGLQPSDAVLDLHIESGLTNYELMRPRVLIDESAGDGSTRRFVVATLLGATFDDGFSQIINVHRVHELDTDNEYVDSTLEWEIRQNESDGNVLFISGAVGSGATMRVSYTAHHLIDDADADLTTVPDGDTDLLTCLAAMFTAYWIARKAGDLLITEMGITEVNFRRLREHWGDRAKELGKEAGEFMSSTLVPISSAGAAVEWPTESQFSGLRISHRDRYSR